MEARVSNESSTKATHALVIGVSHYRHFAGGAQPSARGAQWKMEQLTAAATSASKVAKWLATSYNNPRAPLKTLRVLLSPGDDEDIAADVPAYQAATRANVEAALNDFISDCEANRDNVAIVYVAGHGVRITKTDAIVLLEDCGAPSHNAEPLKGAIDVTKCHRGMDHADAPQTQFWFVDACRQVPEVTQQFDAGDMPGALGIGRRQGTTKSSPLFLATTEIAWGRKGRVTLFCEALLEALGGSGAVGPDRERCPKWHVTAFSLSEWMTKAVAQRARERKVEQNVEPTGRFTNAVLHELAAPPNVRLTITLRPETASAVTSATLKLGAKTPVDVPRAWPLAVDVAAGLYLLEVSTSAPYQSTQDLLDVLPPESVHQVEVGS